MKKLSGILFFAFIFSATLVSCSKDYECHCEFTDGTEQEFEYEGVKKSEAKDACEAQEAILKLVDPGVDCNIH